MMNPDLDPDGDEPTPTWSCNPTLEELYTYIDDRLGEPQRSQFQSHLQFCTGCDDIVHFHVGLKSMLGSCREEMPAEVRQRLLDSITKLF
ncbi:MAG: zf-HC2 domain-containing protein [Acidimicrobiia bacterium]|nr:zf-HC2 domain-containing protein [Acidimicrobiia bacterium]